MGFAHRDRSILRSLAARCREIADSTENRARKQRWTNLNDLRHSGPPLLLVSPEGAWREILPTLPAECEDELARLWERSLRQTLYQHDAIRDDTAFDPVFRVGIQVHVGDFGVPFKQTRSEQQHGAYHDEPVLQNLDSDLDKLNFRSIAVDRVAAGRHLECARKTFGDLLDVRPQGSYWWTCGLTWDAIRLLGLENLMFAMIDNPAGLHRLMRFLSDDMLNFISFFDREELLDYNTGANHIGSGNLGYTTHLPSRGDPVAGPVRLHHLWGFAESQETVGVAPDMFGEFILPYQLPLLERFGLNYYGCCEASETRWAHVRKIPNLRCLSVAPWSNQARCAELFGRHYVYCRKPNPSPVCVGFNEPEIRKEFEETLLHAGALNTVMILKDTHTVENEPDRFARWVQIGREVFNRVTSKPQTNESRSRAPRNLGERPC